jgi:hypothetical protein
MPPDGRPRRRDARAVPAVPSPRLRVASKAAPLELALGSKQGVKGHALAGGWLEEIAGGPTARHEFERREGL